MFHIALVVNPIAGLGGPSALKGSDALETKAYASDLGIESKIPQKLNSIFDGLSSFSNQLRFSTVSGEMGEMYFPSNHSFQVETWFTPRDPSSAIDTKSAVQVLLDKKPDLLLFVGGDGTARDVCSVVSNYGIDRQVCLGIPSGVKMHSGVFAITPKAVVSVITSMIEGKLVAAMRAEVRDIDEASFREGRVLTKHYGEMLVPDDQLLVQTVKCSGLPDDEISLGEIAAFVEEELENECLYLLGSGGSLFFIKEALGLHEPTLLGVDAWFNGEQVGSDLNEPEVLALLSQHNKFRLFISVIGGQGIILGRGNQQLSAKVLQKIGVENVQLVGTQARLLELQGKALCVDSGDDEIDRRFSGYRKVLCGYDDYVLYQVRYVD